jgi:cytoskeletal protein CcmA (bactofilin family)
MRAGEHTNVAGTIIGQGLTIEGELTSDEEVVVAGTIRGKLSADGPVTIEAGALVEADISAASLAVGGTVTGNVAAAERVDLLGGARLIGDVKAARLTIADGASFKGNVDMDV